MLVAAIVGLCLGSGFLVMWRAPRLSPNTQKPLSRRSLAVIIPARDEEQNLAMLLPSLNGFNESAEVIVVDDDSHDQTAAVAQRFGARVVHPTAKPPHFTGKTWACTAGASATTSQLFFFLDADTFFEPGGFTALDATLQHMPPGTTASVLPFAVTRRLYEELSLFFNLVMAFGAGGFGVIGKPRLFGQSLWMDRTIYDRIHGHQSVASAVLENLHLSKLLEEQQLATRCYSGKGVLCMRMYPDGYAQLRDGWTKAFASGATATDALVLVVSIVWLTGLASTVVLCATHLCPSWIAAMLYLLAAMQVRFFARQVGTFRLSTCVLFPIPLLYFFVIFAKSSFRKRMGKSTTWRGRSV